MSTEKSIHDVKILLLGDSGVGKSCLVTRYVEVWLLISGIMDKSIRMCVWDTAGQERFRTLTPNYYRNALGAILVYDVCHSNSLDGLRSWLTELAMHTSTGSEESQLPIKMLVGNKIDLENERQITREQGEQFAQRHQMMFMETSAKSSHNVEQAFEELTLKILQSPEFSQECEQSNAVDVKRKTENGNYDYANICGC
ncbi:hypothetical protein ACOME3_009354 [Neoechinorhynchus agilis]